MSPATCLASNKESHPLPDLCSTRWNFRPLDSPLRIFFFSSFFFHASNFTPRLLYPSFTISTDGRGRREEKKKEREKISTIVTRQLLNAKGGGEIGVRSRNSFRLHQKIISVGARTKQPEGGWRKGYASIFARVTFGCGDEDPYRGLKLSSRCQRGLVGYCEGGERGGT